MEPVKAPWKNCFVSLYTWFLGTLPRVRRLLPGGPSKLRISWGPQKERNSPKSIGTYGEI